MPSRAELNLRADALGFDQTTIPNDSKLEQKVLYLEKRQTPFTGTLGTTTLTSNTTTAAPGDTLTLGYQTYTFVTALTEAFATGTLTNSVSFSDGDMVVAGNRAYIMRTALSASSSTMDEVLIGVNVAASLTNLASTINGNGTPGTTTNVATLTNAYITATSTGTTLVVTHIKVGSGGNNERTYTTATNASWGAAFLTGGADPVANQVLIGAAYGNNLTNMKAAINGAAGNGTQYSSTTPTNQLATATTLSSPTLVVKSTDYAITNADIVTTSTSANLSWTSTVMASGVGQVINPLAVDAAQVSGDEPDNLPNNE